MTRDYRYGRPCIQQIRMDGFNGYSNPDDIRYAILVAIRCPRGFMGCRSKGVSVHKQYWNGHREVSE